MSGQSGKSIMEGSIGQEPSCVSCVSLNQNSRKGRTASMSKIAHAIANKIAMGRSVRRLVLLGGRVMRSPRFISTRSIAVFICIRAYCTTVVLFGQVGHRWFRKYVAFLEKFLTFVC